MQPDLISMEGDTSAVLCPSPLASPRNWKRERKWYTGMISNGEMEAVKREQSTPWMRVMMICEIRETEAYKSRAEQYGEGLDFLADTGSEEVYAEEYQRLRQVDHASVQQVYWQHRQSTKRGPPTPLDSAAGTPMGDLPRGGEASGSDQTTPQDILPTLVHPFTVDDGAATITAGLMGVDINQPQRVEEWLKAPVKRELNWMASDNRQQQKNQSALQVLLSGFPAGLSPAQRQYMIGWMLKQVPEIQNFLKNRGYVDDHTAEQVGRYFNVLLSEPVTVPQGEFWSTMTLITFKAWTERQAFMSRFAGQSGLPLYTDETTPHHGSHIRCSPCSPQWQRKLEAPIRVILSVINKHPDFADQNAKNIFVLWKTLTVMKPCEKREFQEDHIAWARLFYSAESGEFRGRLELHQDLYQLCMSGPDNVHAEESTLWAEQWNLVLWGPQRELDQAETTQYLEAKKQSIGTGKGVSKGKTKKHWSAPFTYNSYSIPFPFELDVVSVEAIAFSWDEYCTKSGGEAHRVNDPKACTYVGKPVVEDQTASPAPEMGARRPKAGDPDYETTFLPEVGKESQERTGGRTLTYQPVILPRSDHTATPDRLVTQMLKAASAAFSPAKFAPRSLIRESNRRLARKLSRCTIVYFISSVSGMRSAHPFAYVFDKKTIAPARGNPRSKAEAKKEAKEQRFKGTDTICTESVPSMDKPVNVMTYDVKDFLISCVDRRRTYRHQSIASKVLMKIQFAARMARWDLLRVEIDPASHKVRPKTTPPVRIDGILATADPELDETDGIRYSGFAGGRSVANLQDLNVGLTDKFQVQFLEDNQATITIVTKGKALLTFNMINVDALEQAGDWVGRRTASSDSGESSTSSTEVEAHDL
ncbi:hypothetical protein AK812_SmicGene9603 [Symbiodinium microadriaticum]|uniref:Uncharacterized protein n=1 Tax=Symbiodinium microadriaticum TaxID=2951 RepID=A0A1Q9EHY6_SYMMI|nr:hypothetical protein AK812_SmicGene9603 [Symbiodinium microadriaticum]